MEESKSIQNYQKPSNIFTVEFEIDPKSTALVVIDMQKNGSSKDFGLGKMWLETIPEQANYWFSRLNMLVVPKTSRTF